MLRAKFVSCGTRDMVPSSFMISQMTPEGFEARDARQVDGGFGLPGADQHAAVARAQRKHVAGPGEILRAGLRIDRGEDGDGAVGGADAGGDAELRVDGFA